MKDTDDIFRLYHREWVTVYTITMLGEHAEPCVQQAQDWIKENLDGRVHDKDIQLQLNTDTGSTFWCHIQVFKDNLKGEFKHSGTAEVFANRNNFDEYTIVPRNSPADHDLRSYGVRKL